MVKRKYFGCRVVQRVNDATVPFFVFYARAKDIVEWAGVKRVDRDGIQRILRPTRSKAITRFLKADTCNTIPGSVLLAFNSDTTAFKSINLGNFSGVSNIDILNSCGEQIEWGILEFSFKPNVAEHLKPALIVDGQHRLSGVSNYEAEDLPLLVVSLLDASLEEQAFQFVVINNKSVRVPTDNVRAIIANIDEASLQDRLLKAGVSYGDKSPVLRDLNDSPNSPFQNLLDWPYNKEESKRIVQLTAIEQSIRYLQALFAIEKDDDSLAEIFCAIWRAVKVHYSELWGENNKFMKKVNITALNEFVAERLKYAWEMDLIDIFDSDAIERQVRNILTLLPKEFWEEEWTVKVQDNSTIRNLIKSELSTLANNSKTGKSWRDGLKLPAEPASE
jgi:DGQHR domain-containing protein